MAYQPTYNRIVEPVGVYDVQQCLGKASGDVATLCLSNNINMWSYKKPVYNTKKETLTASDMCKGRTLSGYITPCGIKMRASTAQGDYMETSGSNIGKVKSAVWEYDNPVLDGSNFFRLTDFDDYYHQAKWTLNSPLVLSFPSTDDLIFPINSSLEGQQLNFQLNFLINQYQQGSLTLQYLFGPSSGGNISDYPYMNYYPAVIMSCGKDWQYVKSASQTISTIGASSALTGVTIPINSQEILAAVTNDGAQSGRDCLLEGVEWTACIALVSRAFSGTTTLANHAIWRTGITTTTNIIRLEYLAPTDNVYVDRKVFTVANMKKYYINSISVAITVVKQTTTSGSFHRWNVSQMVFTFEKGTADTISFVLKGVASCQIGSAYMQGTPDSQGYYTISNSVSVSGTGTKTVTLTLQSNAIYFDPTRPDQYANMIGFSGTLKLENSSFGNWQCNFSIQSSPSESIGTLSQTVNCN